MLSVTLPLFRCACDWPRLSRYGWSFNKYYRTTSRRGSSSDFVLLHERYNNRFNSCHTFPHDASPLSGALVLQQVSVPGPFFQPQVRLHVSPPLRGHTGKESPSSKQAPAVCSMAHLFQICTSTQYSVCTPCILYKATICRKAASPPNGKEHVRKFRESTFFLSRASTMTYVCTTLHDVENQEKLRQCRKHIALSSVSP